MQGASKYDSHRDKKFDFGTSITLSMTNMYVNLIDKLKKNHILVRMYINIMNEHFHYLSVLFSINVVESY